MRLVVCSIASEGWKDDAVFNRLLDELRADEPNEADRVMRFRAREDRLRALAGRTLAKLVCTQDVVGDKAPGSPGPLLQLERTPQNKPFLRTSGNFNFNISHHGNWVVAVSHPTHLVGVDVMRYDEPNRGRDLFFESMRGQFTPHEWTVIGSDLKRFYQFWSLKESYIKAIGIGLGFNLQRASFSLGQQASEKMMSASVTIDSAPQPLWQFRVLELDDTHCIALACGPFSDVCWDFRSAPLSAADIHLEEANLDNIRIEYYVA